MLEIRYGSGENETLRPVFCILPSIIQAIYKSAIVSRQDVSEFKKEMFDYVGNAVKSTLGALINRPQATMSERFQFEGASFVVTVNSFDTGKNFRTDIYMTVVKDAEYENLLSRENVRQLAASISKPDKGLENHPSSPVGKNSEKDLGISRADFVKGCNAALLESAHAQDEKPLSYYDRFILDNNAVEKIDVENGRIVYFKLGEKNLERLTYRSLNLSGWKEIFLALSSSVIKGRLNAVEDFSKFFQETVEVIEKEMHDALAKFEAEVKANTPTEPIERELFARTFSISGLVFEFVSNVLADPMRRENPFMVGFELTIRKFS